MNEINNSPEKKRPSLRLGWAAALSVVCIGLCVLCALGFGGVSGLSLAAVCLAFLFLSDKRWACYAAVPVSVLLSFIASGSIEEALFILLCAPLALCLVYCIASKKSLSVSLVIMTVAVIISMALLMAYSVTELYGKGIAESFLSFGREFKAMIVESFRSISYIGKDKELFALSDDVVESMTEAIIMIMPAVVVVVCEALAFGALWLCRLLCRIFGFGVYFKGREWRVELSLPMAALFLLSYMVAAFAPSGTVPSYAALNLAYIIMPAAVIAGAGTLFGRLGFFKKGIIPKSTKIIFIVACALTLFMSPFSVFPLLAVIGCGAVIWRAVFEYLKKRREENGGDQ